MKRPIITSLEEDFRDLGILPLEEGPRSDAIAARRNKRASARIDDEDAAKERQDKLTKRSTRLPAKALYADALRSRFNISKGTGKIPAPVPHKDVQAGQKAVDRIQIAARQRKAYIDAGSSQRQKDKGKNYSMHVKNAGGSVLDRIRDYRKPKASVADRLKAGAKAAGSKVKAFLRRGR